MLINVKNNSVYSDKFRLSVVILNQIDLATDEDKHYQIDYWAALFKAGTWEEIKMLASENKYLKEASEAFYKLSNEEKIRLQCEAREEYHRIQRSIKHAHQKEIDALTSEIKTLKEENHLLRLQLEASRQFS